MSDRDDLLASGDYARKQIFCPSRVVAWSHGSRFDRAQAVVRARAGGRLLDYGCGDGTFLTLVHDAFKVAHGADVDPRQLAECQSRLGALQGVSFGLTSALETSSPGSWDVVTCMEVLEHCLEDERRRVLGELARLVAPSGIVVISVPIEIGPSLVGKQFFRALAGLRRLGDYHYRERYTPFELLKGLLGARLPREPREGHGPDGPYRYYGHKGFDFRELEAEIRQRFRVDARFFTPTSWLGPVMNSQAWFVCSRMGG